MRRRLLAVGAVGLVLFLMGARPTAAQDNLLANVRFEEGPSGWRVDKDAGTEARFAIEKSGGALGECCARVSLGAIRGWGTQFGQSLAAPAPGRTYTFAVMVKPTKGPLRANLQIERGAKPYDRVAASEPATLAPDRWTEIHVTFTLEKPYPEGWFAYVACRQEQSEYLADGFRLYEGPYVSHEESQRQAMLEAAVSLFDSGSPGAGPLDSATLAGRAGWTKLAEDETTHRFSGDAVLLNNHVALVLRRGAPGAELYGRGPSGFALRAVLAPRPAREAKLQSLAIEENGLGQAAVEVTFGTADGSTRAVLFELAMGQVFVTTEPRPGTTALAVAAPCRFLVLPDFFADDIVVDAAELPVAAAELPSENFLLHLLPGRESIVMTVANDRQQDACVTLAGRGNDRRATSSEIAYGPRGKVWVAVLEGPDIWHQRDVDRGDAGKIVPLGWKAPFPAQWRVDWRQADRLTGSWEMVLEQPGGEFMKPGWLGGGSRDLPPTRSHWTTVLGRFPYPCWIDRTGHGQLQPLKNHSVAFEGPAVIYPLNRIRATPLRRFTVVDVVRATLGVGPCEYVLDVEGQGATMKGRATCATRDALKAIYSAKEQRQRRAEIEQILQEVVAFVTHIRGRIDQYLAFGRQTADWLAQQRKAEPELADFLIEMEGLARAIQADFDARKQRIQTPQYVIDLTAEFRRRVMDYEGPDALDRCAQITNAIVVVGGNQDELVGECRRDVKVLRQRAALAAATMPKAARVANEIRRRTQDILRNAASYEAPRH